MSLLNLFGCQGKNGKQLHNHYFHYYLIQGGGRRHFCVDVESLEIVFYRLEQFDESIVTVIDTLDRLIRLDVTRIRTEELMGGTYSKQDDKAS